MNRVHCEREQAVSDALLAGKDDRELIAHSGRCSICSDIIAIVKRLRLEAELADNENSVPDPGFIWNKALLFSRQVAVDRATRPVKLFRLFACFVICAGLLWLFRVSPQAGDSLSYILEHVLKIQAPWAGPLYHLTFLGGAATLLCTFIGTLYMLRADK